MVIYIWVLENMKNRGKNIYGFTEIKLNQIVDKINDEGFHP
jgi:hypothetical protein